MTHAKRAAAERMAFEQWYDAQQEGRVDPWDVWQAAALLREIAAKPVQEPVGWLNEIDGEFEHSHKPWMDNPTEEWHPVYAAPQQRKPLTTQQIDAAHEQAFRELVATGWNGGMCGEQWDHAAARAIERAHGITGEPT